MSDRRGEPLPRIAIVGAGVCGLVLAQGLQKHGFQVTMYEKGRYVGERAWEWNLILHWALPTLRNMLPTDVWPTCPLRMPTFCICTAMNLSLCSSTAAPPETLRCG
ncbi:hypothetical protein B0T14DRAFT_314122 [Immersiella caudata]|uniref:Uncharacterized protein n=1 Tax=Immersiella caudata TaxID=314043 RepID=A0AA39TS13_9PEZI|nr:hypothetical protein B0T14DRAFT_314122 [Immersiella caudata]